jgi:hypothetical protein
LINNHCHFCPGTKEKVEEVLSMGYGSYWWKMEFVLKTNKEDVLLSFRELSKSLNNGKEN